jgi:type I restriction enzyme S subunit
VKWDKVQLGQVATVSSGDGAPQEESSFASSGIPFIRAGSLSGLLDGQPESKLERIREDEVRVRKMKIYPEDTVVFAKSGMSCTKGYVYQLKQSCCVVNHLATLVCGDRARPQFIRRWFEKNSPARLIANSAYPSIKISDIRAEKIPLPPLEEQKRIAGILDAADSLRAKRREALAKLDDLLQSTFLDLFGDPENKSLISTMLEDGLLKLHKDGNHGSQYPRSNEFEESGIPFLSAKCISEDGNLIHDEVQFLNEQKARTLKIGWIEKGDVLLAHNASVGKTILYNGEFDEALIGTSLTAFRPDNEFIESAYLLGALRSNNFQRQLFANMGQTTRNQVPITAQRRLSFPIPPLDLQRSFAEIVTSVEEQKAKMRKHLEQLDDLFASLQQRAFRGDL